MKLEKFIFQDGAAYEFTGGYAFPGETEYFLNPFGSRIEKGSVFILSHYPIYKLIAPAVKKYEREGDAYKFTGRIGIATVDEYFLDDKGSMLRGMLFRQDKDYPVYTLLAQKHTEGTKFQKGNDDGAGRPQGEGSKLYFYTTDIPIDPSKPTSFKTMKGMSELQEKLKKEFSDPPPFIKQGEDYFLYVKHDVVQKGDWFYSTVGNMIRQALNGIVNINRYIYEKLPLTVIQDGVQYVFTGEYRAPKDTEFTYGDGPNPEVKLLKIDISKAFMLRELKYPIYITFVDYYWKKYPAMDKLSKGKPKSYATQQEFLSKLVNALHSDKTISDAKHELIENFIKYGGYFPLSSGFLYKHPSDTSIQFFDNIETSFDINNPPKSFIQDGGLYELVSCNNILPNHGQYFYNVLVKRVVKFDDLVAWLYKQQMFPIYKRIGGIDFGKEETGNMSGAAIQKLQAGDRETLSNSECLQLFDYWLLKNPVLDYGFVEYEKKPLFQYFKCLKKNGAYTEQTLAIVKSIVYNSAAQEHEKAICSPSGYIEGINHRYQKTLSFEELKSLNVQFMSIGKFFSSVNDSEFIESAVNYKILE